MSYVATNSQTGVSHITVRLSTLITAMAQDSLTHKKAGAQITWP